MDDRVWPRESAQTTRRLNLARLQDDLRRLLQAAAEEGAWMTVRHILAAIESLQVDGVGRTTAQAAPPLDASGAAEADLDSPPVHPRLTPRQLEIARRVSLGLTDREIAGELFLSTRTVEGHVTRLLGKLGFSSRNQIAGWMNGHPDELSRYAS
jgi:non-specific serine/threonine protein kinase